MYALDAAQPFDFEGRMQAKIAKTKQLKVGILGFGTFGQFIAKRLIKAGHKVGGGIRYFSLFYFSVLNYCLHSL